MKKKRKKNSLFEYAASGIQYLFLFKEEEIKRGGFKHISALLPA
jgi:hypothetical protein